MRRNDRVYEDLLARCAKIDRRSTRYRFDLESAIPWSKIPDDGLYFGLPLLERLGLEVAPLRRDPEAHALFEWLFAVATCEEFIELEDVVVAYLGETRAQHEGVKSVLWLEEEELKHIELFRRYSVALRLQQPTWAAAMDRALDASPRAARHIVLLERYPDARVRAFLFWLFTLFFEEYTVYLHEQLKAQAAIQPAWLAAQAAHRKEEEQHVITDREHLRAVRLDPAERETWAKRFLLWIATNVHEFTGLATAHRAFAELRPDLPLALQSFHRTRFRRDLAAARSFRFTREGAPMLEQTIAETRPPRSAPAAKEEPGLVRGVLKKAREVVEAFAQREARPAVRRYKLADLAPAPAEPAADPSLDIIRGIWAEALARPIDDIDVDADFAALGGDSLRAVQIHARLEERYARAIAVEILLECRTVRELSAYLGKHHGPAPRITIASPRPAPAASDAVAVIAATCRFPGAENLDELWNLLAEGRTSFTAIPEDRLGRGGAQSRCPTGSFLTSPGDFDPEAFGLDEAAAREMDPQQRLFLELCTELAAGAATRSIGVFAGSGGNEYFLHFTDELSRFGASTALGNLGNMVAARASQVLRLTGPALTLDAACASSLVAVHLACRSLLAGECELAIAGGVQTNLTPVPYAMFGPTGVLSPTGRCQPYSSAAAGFVPGEGAGAVLLKPLARALADGDRVLAVIRGGAMNNDGGGISGMAPTPAGQIDVIQRAMGIAGVDPSSITYVEGHGSATPIGDVVETRALAQAFTGASGERWLGSIKSNLGHCFAAAGIAGLLKVVLSLHRRQILPTAGLAAPNTRLFSGSSFLPAKELLAWPGESPRRAGISAFGVGGTNCHLILEEAPASSPASPARAEYLLALSAPDGDELRRVARAYAERLPAADLPSFVAGVNRHAERHAARAARAVGDPGEALAFLRDPSPRTSRPPRVCLVFSGPGSQYPGMGKALLESEPVFRDAIAICDAILGRRLPRPLPELLADEAMDRIELTQPVVFAFGYALWRWLSHLGVQADAVLGHSAAEYLAAHVAGAFGLGEALELVSERGKAMAATGPGKMAAVFAPEERVAGYLRDDLGFAALNEPSQVVVSGPPEAVDALLARLQEAGIASQELKIGCAAHSPLMREAADRLRPQLERTHFRPLVLPFYSTMTGARAETLDAAHFAAQLPAPVVFARAVAQARADGFDTFVEVGASGALSHCIEQVLGAGQATVVPLLRRSLPGLRPTLDALATLFEQGVSLAPARLSGPAPLVPEPYPYRRRRFWHASAAPARPTPVRDRVLTPDNEPSIRDHVFRGRAIAPAALLCELILADAGAQVLERVLVSRSLGLDGQARRVWVRRDGERRTLCSEAPGGVEEHCSASIGRPAPAAAIDLAAIRARCSELIGSDVLYAHLAACQMTYGPSMHAVRAIFRGRGELLARLELAPGAERDDVKLHPALLDGAMQAIGGFLVDQPAAADATYFGFSIQRLEAHAECRSACWAHVREHVAFSAGAEIIRCDVDLVDDDGRVLVAYADVGLRRFPGERAATPATASTSSTGLKRYAVEPAPPASQRRDLPEEVLVFAAEAAQIRAVEDLGVHVVAVRDLQRLSLLAPLPRAALAVGDPLPLARALLALGVRELDDFCVLGSPATARVIGLEQPGWRCRAIDRMAAYRLATPRADFALRELGPVAPARFDGVVWITGGAGGIGRVLVARLVELGAKVLVTGRREGVAVPGALYLAADAADPAAMAAALARGERELGRLRGVIHAAGEVAPRLIGDAGPDVARGKRDGALVLHQLLGERELDFVAFCSSMVALYGAPGQASYAAANEALDRLARAWRGPARRVVSFAFGPWRGTGMMSSAADEAFFAASGVVALEPRAAADAMLATLQERGDERHVMIADVTREAEATLHRAERSAPVTTTTKELRPLLVEALGELLGRPLADAEVRVPFRQLGLDSLMAVRVVARLERELGLELHPTLLFEQPSVDDVVAYLEKKRCGIV